jgi:hypothetical protein
MGVGGVRVSRGNVCTSGIVTTEGVWVSLNNEAAEGSSMFTAGASAGTSVVGVNCGSCVEISADKSGTMACGDLAVGDAAGITSGTACRDCAEKRTEPFEALSILDP